MRKLSEIIAQLGIEAEIVGADIEITGPAKLSEATDTEVSFLANPKYEHEVYTTKAGAILVSNDFEPKEKVNATLIKVKDPYSILTKVLEAFAVRPKFSFISPQASIAETAVINKDVFVGDFTVIVTDAVVGEGTFVAAQVFLGKGVKIGSNCVIYPGVKIFDNCVIGDDCIIHAGTAIGSDGFGFAPQKDGTFKKIPQIGNVVVGNNVEIGSNCTIDKATMGSTIIEDNVKLDNLIQVGHNAIIRKNTVIAAQSGVSGSTELGEGCIIGGQVGFAGHLKIAPNTQINAKSGIAKSVKEKGSKLNGIPAYGFIDSLRSHAVYRKLPELEKKLNEIEEMLSLLRK